MRPYRILRWLPCLALLSAFAVQAQTVVPSPLEPWRGWATHEQEYRACPLIAGTTGASAADFVCAWPGVLQLAVDGDGARFVQHWRVDAETWISLPGDAAHWPQQATLDGRPVPIVDRNGRPMLRAAAGDHELRAIIPWRERPQSLGVPSQVGLVALTIDGKAVAPVQRDGDELTLGRGHAAAPEADRLELRVYRRLVDDVPAILTTRIHLVASGQVREEVIGPVLPQGYEPLELEGEWPARFEADGRIRVRVQPGNGTLSLEARAIAPLESATARLGAAPWPEQEIWSYSDAPHLRVTAASSALPVDPKQARVPEAWRDLPAFALGDGDVLAIEQRSRGLAPDERNRLTLDRQMWLDFDGGGWFARDRVQGTMRQGWRFDAMVPFVLERAQASGLGFPDKEDEPLLVTHGAEARFSGVEWRTPKVDLAAGLRIAQGSTRLPVTGWQDSFDRVDTVLHLPDGYRLLGAPGADRAVGSWMSRWDLLDVFLAAVLALLAWRALGMIGGIAAIAYLVLGYQEGGAPLWSLLAVLVLVVLARELPTGKLASVVRGLRNAALLVLILVALPFVAGQVRQALYPQLESHPVGFDAPFAVMAPVTEAPMMAPAPSSSGMAETQSLETVTVSGRIRNKDSMKRYDASTVVQTGAGEPGWQRGHRYALSWSGPVLPTQDVHLVIVPPWLVRLLRLVLVALLAFLVLRIAVPAWRRPRQAGSLIIAALAMSSLGYGTSSQAQAFPPAELLDQLRSRLTAAPACAPACAAIATADISAGGDTLEIVLEAHAAERIALPLPFDEKALVLRSLRVNGVVQDTVASDGHQRWVALPRGVHRVVLSFVAAADKVALAFPMQPMRVQFAGEGWDASGLVDDRLQTETLTLVRTRGGGEAAVNAGTQRFAPFVQVQRTITLDLNWAIETLVSRLSPREGGFTVDVPTLAGEHVTSAEAKVVNGRVLAAIDSDSDSIRWNSGLDKSDTLELTAPPLGDRAEVWRIVVNPSWHATFSGVPEIDIAASSSETDYHAHEFHPLPGETLAIAIIRPQAAQGATRAIDSVRVRQDIGQRASTTTLSLAMRASQGGEHSIALPPGAEVLGVSRNGNGLNLRPRDGTLSLPLLPGKQDFEIRFRNDATLGFRSATPAIALGLPAANIDLDLQLPHDRWLLATSGPAAGPAVLYWGELLVLLLVAFALARVPHSPLTAWQWALLGVGFSTVSWWSLLLVVAWLFALEWRGRTWPASAWRFNLVQIGLALLTFAALLALFTSIQDGLLGRPDMHVAGNGSNADALRWFADRSHDALPVAQAFTLPLWSYQLAMLGWALWLAGALIGWLRRGFAAWTRDGIWHRLPRRRKPDAAATANDSAAAAESTP